MGIVIGLDIGTSGTKAIAMDAGGARLASALVEYPLHSPRPQWAEQDPADWRRAALEALGRVAAEIDAKAVAAVGLTGQMHGSVFLDARHHVIRPALLWCDQRTAAQCAAITETVGADRLIAMAANPALTGFTAPKILWLRDHEPDHYARVRQVLLPKDYIRHELTGQFATDVADASGTLLFDVARRAWHPELLKLLGLDPAWFPPAYEGPEITGTLHAAAAEATGLPEGIPVVAGGGDQAANGVGCGIVRAGIASASLGTSGVVFVHSDMVQVDPAGRVHTFCHSAPGRWHLMGVMLSAGGALRWFRDTLCGEEVARGAAEGRDPYGFITEAAASVPPGAEGLTFLPYLTGERTPHKDPDAKGAFVGLSLRHGKAHLARAVLEGVAFGMRDSLEIIRGLGIPVAEVRMSGGGARSPLWRQIMADVCGAPMVAINADEGPAYGAAILAAVGAGLHPDVGRACDAVIRETGRVEPDAGRAAAYAEDYAEFRATYPALAPGFARTAARLA